jgi:hypothetical protein
VGYLGHYVPGILSSIVRTVKRSGYNGLMRVTSNAYHTEYWWRNLLESGHMKDLETDKEDILGSILR